MRAKASALTLQAPQHDTLIEYCNKAHVSNIKPIVMKKKLLKN
jgi:hypothetical protein